MKEIKDSQLGYSALFLRQLNLLYESKDLLQELTGFIYEFAANPLTSHEDFLRSFRKLIPSSLTEDLVKLAKFYDKENYIQTALNFKSAIELAKTSKEKALWTAHRNALVEFYITMIEKFTPGVKKEQSLAFEVILGLLDYHRGLIDSFYNLFGVRAEVRTEIDKSFEVYTFYQELLTDGLTDRSQSRKIASRISQAKERYVKQVNSVQEIKLFLKELGLNLKSSEILALFLNNKRLLFEEDMLLATTTKDIVKILKIESKKAVYKALGLTKLNQNFTVLLSLLLSMLFLYVLDTAILNFSHSVLVFYSLKIALIWVASYFILRLTLKYMRKQLDVYVKRRLNKILRFEGN